MMLKGIQMKGLQESEERKKIVLVVRGLCKVNKKGFYPEVILCRTNNKSNVRKWESEGVSGEREKFCLPGAYT